MSYTITLARYAGFCYGVKRAVDRAFEVAKTAENAEKAYQTAVTNAENYAALDSANARLSELEKLRPEIDEANRRTAVHLKAAKASADRTSAHL